MPVSRHFVWAAIACVVSLIPPPHQQGRRLSYQPTDEPLRFSVENDYLMYFVRGSDTLGQPIHTQFVEHFLIERNDGVLHLKVEAPKPDGSGVHTTVFTIDPFGEVLFVDGRSAHEVPSPRIDVLPRFPKGAVEPRVGLSWTDSANVTREEAYGASYYRTKRAYSVLRVADSMRTRIVMIRGQGQVSLRHGGWDDSTAGTVWWQEVSGPIEDTVWFDAGSGQLLASVTNIDLVGVGGGGPPAATVTMPAGIRSRHRRVRSLT